MCTHMHTNAHTHTHRKMWAHLYKMCCLLLGVALKLGKPTRRMIVFCQRSQSVSVKCVHVCVCVNVRVLVICLFNRPRATTAMGYNGKREALLVCVSAFVCIMQFQAMHQ